MRVLGKYTDPTDHKPYTQTLDIKQVGKYTDLWVLWRNPNYYLYTFHELFIYCSANAMLFLMTLIWRIFPTPKKKNLTSRIFCYLTCFHDFFYFSPKKKNLISRFFLLLLPKHSEKTRNLLLPLTEKFFLQINYLVISLVNVLLSRNFCHKSVRVNFRNFHTVHCERGKTISLSPKKYFVKSTVTFTKFSKNA